MSKYPKPSRDLQYHQPKDDNSVIFIVSEKEVHNAIVSFPNGLAAGIDGLRSQHLKKFIDKSLGEAEPRILSQITSFCKPHVVRKSKL